MDHPLEFEGMSCSHGFQEYDGPMCGCVHFPIADPSPPPIKAAPPPTFLHSKCLQIFSSDCIHDDCINTIINEIVIGIVCVCVIAAADERYLLG